MMCLISPKLDIFGANAVKW